MAADITTGKTRVAPSGGHAHAPDVAEHLHHHAPHGVAELRFDLVQTCATPVARFPHRLLESEYYTIAYPVMYLARRMDEMLLELFRKGYVKGTVALGTGNEAVAVGMAMPLRPGVDIVALMHRDLAAHLLLGATPYRLFCQYMANAESPTHGAEGNVHHGDAANRRFPMLSHLGKMPSLVVGGVWAARRNGEDVFGLAVLGDGASSTGEFHEALNLASVRKTPVLFLIENNGYSFSTPISLQYNCRWLADRAAAYGIKGRCVDGTDAYAVYSAVCDALQAMHAQPEPTILECLTLRLHGHAAYDKGEYIPQELLEQWRQRDPVPAARRKLQQLCGYTEENIAALEAAIEDQLQAALAAAMPVPRPNPRRYHWNVYAATPPRSVPPFRAERVKNGDAVRLALDYLLQNNPKAFLMGLDVGVYGSAFKTCKGLIEKFGAARVLDMPVCESAQVGFALGASQLGGEPIVEFQFADFSTEAVTQLGLNVGSWFTRTRCAAPLLFRLPCGGGVTLGAFHSGEFEGLWSRFPGLKLLYPATAQETFEALVAGFYDRNPCLVFEHKALYWSKSGTIDFDGRLEGLWQARVHREGDDLTLVAFGAMLHEALDAAQASGLSVEVINPFVLQPLDMTCIIRSLEKTGRLLVVQESGATQGLGDRIISQAVQQSGARWRARPRLLAAPDCPVPFAPELEAAYRPSSKTILAAIRQMCEES